MTWLMIQNPASGNRRRSRETLEFARDRGFDIVESEQPGETVDLASEAVTRGRNRIAACGGDGTVNQVVRGVKLAGRLSETTIGIVPTGTGNGFARDIGITNVPQAFDVLERGRERWLDIGIADSRPFLKSCISGFPADVSARTTPELKQLTGRLAYGLGILPYILEALRTNQIPPPRFRSALALLTIQYGRARAYCYSLATAGSSQASSCDAPISKMGCWTSSSSSEPGRYGNSGNPE